MTPRELIQLFLSTPGVDLDKEINISLCLTIADSDTTDVPAIIEVHGLQSAKDGDGNIEFVVVPKDKRDTTSDFETLFQLLEEGSKIEVHFEEAGMYFFVDGELRREMDFRKDFNGDIPSEQIKKLIYEL